MTGENEVTSIMFSRLFLHDGRICFHSLGSKQSGSNCFFDNLPTFHHCLAASFLTLQKFFQFFLQNGDLVLIDYTHFLPLLLFVFLQPSEFLFING